MTGKVVAINISEKKGVVKKPIPEGNFIKDFGLEGDAHAGNGPRQVSLLAQESIDRARQRGLQVGPGDFAENLTTQGLDLLSLPIGTRLRLGSAVELEVTQIGKADHPDNPIRRQVGEALIPREGIFARVLRGGEVRPGDPIEVRYVSGRNSNR